ncbi:nitroreductase family protein [Salinarimonas soli]|uniref:Putative NAD(P)H nitroreductase n=1 Tax=Salinarimonas soli TaxID=1638099 RepID=A0A5B2V8N6_9HYPH|nr:nitroreductase [Salinarimonas soli]KAA2235166.1 nitroreductase [Salinarimonas soli]
MNETIGFLARRRSVPAAQLREPGPSAAELGTILSIASRVPDHGKLAPWRFIVIEGEARHQLGETIARIFQADAPDAPEDKLVAERERLARAPLVVAVVSGARAHPKIPDWEQVLSAGAVCMNLVTAANALGFGTAWVTEWIAYDRRFLDALGLAPEERLAGFIHIGRPAMVPSDRPRPDLAQIVTRA